MSSYEFFKDLPMEQRSIAGNALELHRDTIKDVEGAKWGDAIYRARANLGWMIHDAVENEMSWSWIVQAYGLHNENQAQTLAKEGERLVG